MLSSDRKRQGRDPPGGGPDRGRRSVAADSAAAATLDHSPAAERLVLAAVARAKEGDADALRYLYLRYADNVYGYVCSIVRDEHEAEDVTQQIFAKLMTALRALRAARRAVLGLDPARRPQRGDRPHARPPAGAARGGPRRPTPRATTTPARERFADLRLALDALPAEQRDVIVLRFLVGLSPREIAERIGRSEDAVHGLQHRGRRRLRARDARARRA